MSDDPFKIYEVLQTPIKQLSDLVLEVSFPSVGGRERFILGPDNYKPDSDLPFFTFRELHGICIIGNEAFRAVFDAKRAFGNATKATGINFVE